MEVKFCVVFVWVMMLCRLVCRARYKCFSGVYFNRLKTEDSRSMCLRKFNPQGYNVNEDTAENRSVNSPLAYCFTSNLS